MLYETEAASSFWLSKLRCSELTLEQQNTFLSALIGEMGDKFANHWYEKEPIRGQGYRSIVCDVQHRYADTMLLKAAKTAKFDFFELYNDVSIRMWVDPGEVEVENVVPPTNRKIIYKTPQVQEQEEYYDPYIYVNQQMPQTRGYSPYQFTQYSNYSYDHLEPYYHSYVEHEQIPSNYEYDGNWNSRYVYDPSQEYSIPV